MKRRQHLNVALDEVVEKASVRTQPGMPFQSLGHCHHKGFHCFQRGEGTGLSWVVIVLG